MSRFNILIIAQSGRVQYEAALFAASLRHSDPDFTGRLIVAEPQPGDRWGHQDPRIDNAEIRTLLERLGAEIVPFDSVYFGAGYPQGNKIEALKIMPPEEPFVFFDSDTLVTGKLSEIPFDFQRPSASMARENSWPKIELYGPGYARTWSALYDRFGLDFESSLDLGQPDEYWQRYMYFNAGWFFGACPVAFGERFTEYATTIRDDPPEELICQELYPWLDQIALPLVIHSFGGGRPGPDLAGLDGAVTHHWRVLPLMYARAPDRVIEVLEEVTAPNWIKKVLKQYEPFRRMIFQGKGRRARAMFDRDALPRKEQAIRNQLKQAKLWMR